MSAFKFKTELFSTIGALDSNQEEKSLQFRQKISESIENLGKMRNGLELNDIQFYKPQAPQQKSFKGGPHSSRTERPENGLPIFDNKNYLQDLTKLLSSRDLDECYDYDANDASYKKLYECLTYHMNQFNTKQGDHKSGTLDQSVTQLEGVGQISDTHSNAVSPKIAVRKSNVNLNLAHKDKEVRLPSKGNFDSAFMTETTEQRMSSSPASRPKDADIKIQDISL
jgi:hypothetical protein